MSEELPEYGDEEAGSPEGLSITALLAAVVAGLVGAAAWAAITWTTDYEVGYVAWAIGGLVGFAAVKAGGRGAQMAVLCAVLALASIFGGKMAAVHFSIEAEVVAIEEQLTPEYFHELQTDAEDLAGLSEQPSDEELAEFIASHGYSVQADALNITEEEIAFFREDTIPWLREIHAGELSQEDWREGGVEDFRAMIAEQGSLVTFVIDDLSAIDLLFAFLGLSTAFGLVRRAG